MRRFGEYNIAPIRCETKTGDESVKEGLYKVNGVLYPHKFDYVCPALLSRMRGELRGALVELYNTKVPTIAQKKKNEILQKGKAYFQTMKELERDFKWEPTDADDIQRVLHYWVAAYVKEKPNLTPEKAMEILKKSKQAYADYYVDASRHIPLDHISTASFVSVQQELKDYICSSLGA